MKKKIKIVTVILVLSSMLLITGSVFIKPAKAEGLTITIAISSLQATGISDIIDDFLSSSYNTEGVTDVNVIMTGVSADEQLTYVTTQMVAQSSEIDVVGMDTSWTAQFASNGWIIPLSMVDSSEMANYIPGLVAAGTYNGVLYAFPYFANLGVLYYRADLLDDVGATPADLATWEGLTAIANAILNDVSIQNDYPDLVGYVGQFDNYEGGTCNFLEWIGSNGVTNIFNPDGSANLNNSDAAYAMNFLQQLVAPRYTDLFYNNYIIPRSGLIMDESSSVNLWAAGNAIFMRQWTFAYGISMGSPAINAIDEFGNYTQFGVVPIPHFAGATDYKTSEIGGSILGISEYSTHQAAALSLIRWLGQTEAQKYELTALSNFPALLSVYSNPPTSYEWTAEFLPAFEYTLVRPIRPDYASISSELSYYFFNILDGAYTAQVGLDKMNAAVDLIVHPVPSGPLNLNAIPGTDSITLTWQVPSHNGGQAITGYNIYRGDSSGTEVLLTTVGSSTLTYTDTGLTAEHTYYYTVSANNSAGEGSQSNEVHIAPFGVPSGPLNLNAIPGKNSVTLTWQVPSHNGGLAITGYNIYRGTSSGTEVLLIMVGSNILTYTDPGLTAGQTYYYTISAINSAGEGLQPNEVDATPFGVPSEPLKLNAIPGNNNITLTWQIPSNDGNLAITGYNIYRGDYSGTEVLLTTVDSNILTYTDTGLTTGQTYYYTVSADNSAGESVQSNEVHTAALGVPSEPINLNAMPGDEIIILTWQAPYDDGGSAITGYNIYRGDSSGTEVLLTTVGADDLSYTDSNLVSYQIYYYQVSAINSAGEGQKSSEIKAITGSINQIGGMDLKSILLVGFIGVVIVVVSVKKSMKKSIQ